MSNLIEPDSKFILWLDKYVVDKLDIGKPVPRVFGFTLFFKKTDGTGYSAELMLPKAKGDWLWRNGLISFYFHLPFCISLSLRIPRKYKDQRWGHTLQACLGWKSYNGRPAAILRFQNDDHGDYNNPNSGPLGRAKGLEEGWV